MWQGNECHLALLRCVSSCRSYGHTYDGNCANCKQDGALICHQYDVCWLGSHHAAIRAWEPSHGAAAHEDLCQGSVSGICCTYNYDALCITVSTYIR